MERKADEITDEFIDRLFIRLVMNSAAFVNLQEPKQVSRMVIATFEADREIMFALEGSGCIFIKEPDPVNEYRFISAGFQLGAAQQAVRIFKGLMGSKMKMDATIQQAYPQLSHQQGSSE
jgi:hypothetical protein